MDLLSKISKIISLKAPNFGPFCLTRDPREGKVKPWVFPTKTVILVTIACRRPHPQKHIPLHFEMCVVCDLKGL